MSQRPLYIIADWDLHFETYESKRVSKANSWVAMPNKHDGKSYRRLIREKDAPAIYGAWALIVQLGSKMPVRGVLADLDGPLDADDFEDKTGLPARIFARALSLVTQDRIGWMKMVTDQAEIRTLTASIRARKTAGSRKDPQNPADSADHPQNPADSADHPQNPADSADHPQNAGTPADSRSAAGDSAPRGRARADRTVPDSTGQDTLSPRGSASEITAVLESTEAFLASLFGSGAKKRTRLSDNGRRALAAWKTELPLTASQQTILRWFYGLPDDPQDFDLRTRKKSAEKLAEELFAEIDRAEAYADKGAGTRTKKETAPEPEGWREKFAQKYPRAAIPPTWAEVDSRIQEDLR